MADVIDYGKVAYYGYVDFLFLNCNIMCDRTWEDLGENIKEAYRAAAKAVMEKNSARA